MGFSRQEYWSGLPFPSPGDLPDAGIEPGSPALQVNSLPIELPGKPHLIYDWIQLVISHPISLDIGPCQLRTHHSFLFHGWGCKEQLSIFLSVDPACQHPFWVSLLQQVAGMVPRGGLGELHPPCVSLEVNLSEHRRRGRRESAAGERLKPAGWLHYKYLIPDTGGLSTAGNSAVFLWPTHSPILQTAFSDLFHTLPVIKACPFLPFSADEFAPYRI